LGAVAESHRRRAPPGKGVGGSDRLTVVFADGVIKNQWLQVTVKATDRTGLAAPDVFYFGSLVGDVGDTTAGMTQSRINVLDLAQVKKSLPNNNVFMTSRFDIDRDGKINATDLSVIKSNLYATLEMLDLSAVPGRRRPGRRGVRWRLRRSRARAYRARREREMGTCSDRSTGVSWIRQTFPPLPVRRGRAGVGAFRSKRSKGRPPPQPPAYRERGEMQSPETASDKRIADRVRVASGVKPASRPCERCEACGGVSLTPQARVGRPFHDSNRRTGPQAAPRAACHLRWPRVREGA
jgi:hypothetical protein